MLGNKDSMFCVLLLYFCCTRDFIEYVLLFKLLPITAMATNELMVEFKT